MSITELIFMKRTFLQYLLWIKIPDTDVSKNSTSGLISDPLSRKDNWILFPRNFFFFHFVKQFSKVALFVRNRLLKFCKYVSFPCVLPVTSFIWWPSLYVRKFIFQRLYLAEGNKYEEAGKEIENERERHVLIELKVAWFWSVLLRLNFAQLL